MPPRSPRPTPGPTPTAAGSLHAPLAGAASSAVVPAAAAAAASAALSALQVRELACEGRTVTYTLRVSPRARSMNLMIRPDTGLVVTVPVRHAQDELDRFLGQHRRWILRHIDRFSAIAERLPRRWPYGATLPYRGVDHEVILQQRPGSGAVARTDDGRLIVMLARPGIESARRLLKRWYVVEAGRVLADRTYTLGAALDIQWRRISVRDQRHRWGSCSVQGNLNFNYRLVMAPTEVLDYVVTHELLHRRQMNHSRRFWMLVQASCPSYRASVDWLHTYGPYLNF